MTTTRPVELSEIADHLYSAVLSDSLDEHGYRRQVLGPRFRPVDPASRLVGRAATIQVAEAFEVAVDPYRGMIDAIDSVVPQSVVVIATGGIEACGMWGELFSTAARARGARGAIIDGYTRDRDKILALGFPVISRGGLPIDMKGRATFLRSQHRVAIDDVPIGPGDLVFGDRDGVVVVPTAVEAEVLAWAFDKIGKEDLARVALSQGRSMGDVWNDLGVL